MMDYINSLITKDTCEDIENYIKNEMRKTIDKSKMIAYNKVLNYVKKIREEAEENL